jgi:hypothetical protein
MGKRKGNEINEADVYADEDDDQINSDESDQEEGGDVSGRKIIKGKRKAPVGEGESKMAAIFGGQATAGGEATKEPENGEKKTGLFGSVGGDASKTTSLFNSGSGSLFGGAKPANGSSLFSGTPPTGGNSLFGGNTSGSLFGNANKEAPKGGIFG